MKVKPVPRVVSRPERRRRPSIRSVASGVAALAVAVLGVVLPATAAGAHGASGGVLLPSATPYGYSRTDMTRLLAAFTASGNNPELYPDTPFQVLFAAEFDVSFVTKRNVPCEPGTEGCGIFVTQQGRFANTFHVARGTTFFVPVDNADDSPPIVGDFPSTLRGAKNYLFDPNQLGGKGFVICIDHSSVGIGREYVAGPVTVPPLPDGGGTHMITLGAFLAPMSRGSHVVQIQGGYFGKALYPATGLAFIRFDFTYSVTVA